MTSLVNVALTVGDISFNSVKVSNMGCLMLKELVKIKIIPVVSVMVGSLFSGIV